MTQKEKRRSQLSGPFNAHEGTHVSAYQDPNEWLIGLSIGSLSKSIWRGKSVAHTGHDMPSRISKQFLTPTFELISTSGSQPCIYLKYSRGDLDDVQIAASSLSSLFGCVGRDQSPSPQNWLPGHEHGARASECF